MLKLQKGFTLIELLVVISIIGVLTTLVFSNLNAARSRARDAQRKSDMRNISTGLRLYFNDWGTYPGQDGSANINGCGNGTPEVIPTSTCTWGGSWSNGSAATYMTVLPKDPLSTQQYFYNRDPLYTDKYTVSACLENGSDPSGVTATNANSVLDKCPSLWVFVIQP